ncbi:MAG: DUF1998 domain-containing protein, partial [Desulfovibrionaceae bacterium]|nr:DUF1998 domain-containing protein [Desulfovibrionaceae bacterium]
AALITNPDMLHLGILPHHERWTTFLASLAFIVLDEAHIYRGIFGSHMAQLLQRLQRICLRYNARPVHILCTATVGNPLELAGNLLGPSCCPESICQSGAPQGKRHFLFMDPEDSPSTLVIQLLQAALARNLRTIVYCRSRRMTELVSLWASEKSSIYRSKISAYRAGFLPEERRAIEERMASGELLAVISTSALELGIDIGNLDVCILAGYPGSIISTLQRGGRVGRKGQESAVILVGGEDALDQFFIHHPEEFFNRPPEKAVLSPHNEIILGRHLECAAAEFALKRQEAWMQNPAVLRVASELEQKGLLLKTADGNEWLAARKRPHRDVDIRGSGATFHIVDPENNVIGSVDVHHAFRETHPGAVYLHKGRSYIIRELDLGAHLARAVPETVGWHTRARSSKSTEILETQRAGYAFSSPVFFGKLRVTECITGYERRQNGSLRLMDISPLDLPPQIFVTEGFWFTIPEDSRKDTEDKLYHFMGSIHALEHLCIGLMPLQIMADRNDFGGISIPMHPQTAAPTVFVYDGLPGGSGLTRSAFPILEDIFTNMLQTLKSCPCETGCPSCIQSPKCGSGNRPLDKAGALFLLSSIMQSKAERPGPPMPIGIPAEEKTETPPVVPDAPCPASMAGAAPAPTPAAPKTASLSSRIMVFDVETRHSAADVGGWSQAGKMGVSIAVVWDGETFLSFQQDDLQEMFRLLQTADLVVGFNSFRFDYAVLQPFAHFDLHTLPGLDLLEHIQKRLHYRVSLDNLGQATLGSPKSSNGLQALQWWKEGRLEDIRAYCQQDVAITRDLFLFGRREGYVLFTNKAGQKVRIPISW